MKFRIILLFTLAFFIKSQAQITKGNWMFGGNISLAATNYKSENYYGEGYTLIGLKVNPNIGYFLADQLAVGVKSTIRRDKVINGTGYTDFNIGPYFRYYFLSTEHRINFLAEGLYQYGFEEGNQARVPKNSFAISTGAVAFFNSSVGIEFLISYTNYKFTTIAGSNGILQMGLGLQVHLEK